MPRNTRTCRLARGASHAPSSARRVPELWEATLSSRLAAPVRPSRQRGE